MEADHRLSFHFNHATACNATQGIAKGFCPSVCQMHGLCQNERKLCQYSYTTWKIFILVFWQEEWLVGTTPSMYIGSQ